MSADGDRLPPPALAQRILLAVLPDSHREAVVGDLDEMYTELADRANSRRATWWYRKEVAITICHGARWRLAAWLRKTTSSPIPQEECVLPIGTATNRPVAFALSMGVLGFAASFVIYSLIGLIVHVAGRGWWLHPMFMQGCVYGLLFPTIALYLRAERVVAFSQRLALSLGAFMTMVVLQYAIPLASFVIGRLIG